MFEVQHQPRAHRILQRALASERMPHAYIFAGPEGVGREMLAVRLGQTLLCESRTRVELPAELATGMPASQGLDACGQCDDCRLVQAGTHPDLFVIYRQLNREHPDSLVRKQKALQLGVDVLRHFLIERVSRRPMRGRAKFFIVREADRMSDAAQNSLLKTLEEPPPDTFLVLVTAAMDRMLPTTRSRCQPVAFQPLPTHFVAEKLHGLRPDTPPAELTYAAGHSGGSLGIASRLMDDGLFAMKQGWGNRLVELVTGGKGFAPHLIGAPLLADAKTLGKQASERDPDISETDAVRSGLQLLLASLAGFYADAQRQVAGSQVAIVNADQPQVISTMVGMAVDRLTASLYQIADAEAAIGRNAAVELTLETMLIQLAAIARGAPLRRMAS